MKAETKGVGDAVNVLDFSGGYTSTSNASHAYISDANSSGLLDFSNGTTDVSFSFAFWFKPDAGGTSDYRYLFSKYAVVLGDAQGYYCYYGDENATTTNRRGSLFISLRDEGIFKINSPLQM